MIVYVWGNLTADNFTPRPGKDTVGRPGQRPGLSAFASPPANRKSQAVDLAMIGPALKGFPDELDQGGTQGHVAITPVDDSGEIDVKALEQWASFRKTGRVHPFTQVLLDAIVEPNVWIEE
ncbi:MAG: hypothetical protein HUU20_09935 [Pirellulales bacterium]|nr:hypothetical protein [Pirellulales bacterium]